LVWKRLLETDETEGKPIWEVTVLLRRKLSVSETWGVQELIERLGRMRYLNGADTCPSEKSIQAKDKLLI
jgi:hypothetical protein